jgi:hypothetical protein|tara:strand:+ start:5694 stop:6323 length:630 start_codon:yes stop_codon:yes gene_type:complete
MLANQIWQFGNHIQLRNSIDQKKLLEEIKPFENDWHQYNVFKPEIKRYGLDIINESGELVPGPAVNSLIEWNKRYGTEWGETDFTETTPVYDASEEIQKLINPIKNFAVRTHILKLPQGGFFPPHRDNCWKEQDTFRLIVPLQSPNPRPFRFILEDKTLFWNLGSMYAVNTTLEHCLFNMGNVDSLWLVINALVTEEAVKYVCNNMEIT